MLENKEDLASEGWDRFFDESYEEAQGFFQRSLKLDPEYVDALNGLAQTLKELGKLQDAEQTIRRATELEKDNAYVWYVLGNILQDQERLDEAKLCYLNAIEIEPETSDYHLAWGLLELSRDEFSAAEFAVREAIRHSPQDPIYWQQLAIVFQWQGRQDEAKEAMDEADRLMTG